MYVLAGIIACMAFVLAIIVIALGHQQKMAALQKRQDDEAKQPALDANQSSELIAVRKELAELKAMLHMQMIANDSLPRLSSGANERDSDGVRERLEAK
jgi:hypothetical protein